MSVWIQVLIVSVLAADGLDRAKLEACLEKKDAKAIVQAFKDHEEEVLPFFDEYLEGGLAAIEKKEPDKVSQDSFARGVAFAKLADEAFGGKVFENYATAFFTWNAEQQKQFREGQTEFGKGRDLLAQEPAKALEHFEKGVKLSRPLGDVWGGAMCMSKIAAAKHALGKHDEAITAATTALKMNEWLHLLGPQAGDLIQRAQSRAEIDKKDECEKDLASALEIAKRVQDEKRRADLLKRCREVYLKVGNQKAADAIDKDLGKAAK